MLKPADIQRSYFVETTSGTLLQNRCQLEGITVASGRSVTALDTSWEEITADESGPEVSTTVHPTAVWCTVRQKDTHP